MRQKTFNTSVHFINLHSTVLAFTFVQQNYLDYHPLLLWSI